MNNHSEKRLLAPVLDRLLDNNASSRSASAQPHQVIRQLRESVRRDLEYLFNTRFRCVSPPEGMPNLNKSLLNYGLPDLSTINLTTLQSRERFCRQIERTIKSYEPRIQSVKVRADSKIDPEDPVIRFRVEAMLYTNPAPELIVFDSALNPITQNVDVSEIM